MSWRTLRAMTRRPPRASNDTGIQRRTHEGAKRPRRPADCNAGLGGTPRFSGSSQDRSVRELCLRLRGPVLGIENINQTFEPSSYGV